ncbi:hypothetical protein B0H16DRAFT_1744737 [Mycena metata]|uniref:Reverse transcriptase zinc-binding domain-containing protein n=1 Tax=Mycena metata TaxID=1033252 RepID=A0AAD7H449_9AGAR|nr:hypothetical protein B0H16DRAFT_1744737 [Mycena metata]
MRQQWPSKPTLRYQAWFVYAVLFTIGRRALLLDETWRVYTHIHKFVLGGELRQHKLADESSDEHTALNRLTQVMDLVRAPQRPVLMDTGMRVVTGPASVTESSAESDSLSLLTGKATTPSSPESLGSSTQQPAITALPSNLLPAVRMNLRGFLTFLNQALTATRIGNDTPNPTVWQAHMLSDMDCFCPFRELAPSRARAAGPEGPYVSPFAASTSGFLSALIFRAITFNTNFFRQSHLCYTTSANFEGVMAQASQRFRSKHGGANPPLSFFCNSWAYGPHNHGWKGTVGDRSTARKDWGLGFLEFYKWLTATDSGRVRFQHLGPLGAYLLAADYTYTGPQLIGVVESPRCEACGAANETRAHYLLECPHWEPFRQPLHTACREVGFYGSLHLAPLLTSPKLLKPMAAFVEATGRFKN